MFSAATVLGSARRRNVGECLGTVRAVYPPGDPQCGGGRYLVSSGGTPMRRIRAAVAASVVLVLLTVVVASAAEARTQKATATTVTLSGWSAGKTEDDLLQSVVDDLQQDASEHPRRLLGHQRRLCDRDDGAVRGAQSAGRLLRRLEHRADLDQAGCGPASERVTSRRASTTRASSTRVCSTRSRSGRRTTASRRTGRRSPWRSTRRCSPRRGSRRRPGPGPS